MSEMNLQDVQEVTADIAGQISAKSPVIVVIDGKEHTINSIDLWQNLEEGINTVVINAEVGVRTLA